MSYQRTHRYCGGRGWITLASGAEATCQPCNGSGKITIYTKAEKSARKSAYDRWNATRELVQSHARQMTPPEGVARLIFSLDALSGFENLAGKEPERLEKLYASLDAGRIDDVVYALYAYRVAQANEGLSCVKCAKGNLPKGLMCDREAATQEMCLRCCPHNHG